MKKNITKRRENGLLAFSVDLSAVLKTFQKEKITITDIKENWSHLGNEDWLEQLIPISFKTGNLTVKASFGAIALAAMSQKEIIKEKVNTYFGKDIIKDVKVTQ